MTESGADPISREEIEALLNDRRNWGRWGKDDQLGTVNLVTAAKRHRAAESVRSGRLVSLSRPIPVLPGPVNPNPAHHYMKRYARGTDAGKAGYVVDYVGIDYHGSSCTHLDALCHIWVDEGMWNGRNPDVELGFNGARFGHVDNLGNGIVTRVVLLDLPRHRGVPYVTHDEPVHASELYAIAEGMDIDIEPGDAMVVYCGRERYDLENPAWGGAERRPGLHSSCLKFLRDVDAALLVWDMSDAYPNDTGMAYGVHSAIWAFGLPLVDNALLEPLADACAEEQRDAFLLTVAPLRVVGGTGSPVNPIAML